MAKYNVHDLARELRKNEEDIINICVGKGMSGVTRATMISDKLADEIRQLFPKPEAPARKAEEDNAASAKKKFHVVYHPEHANKRPAAKKPTGKRPVSTDGQKPDVSVMEAVKDAVTGSKGRPLARPDQKPKARPARQKPLAEPVEATASAATQLQAELVEATAAMAASTTQPPAEPVEAKASGTTATAATQPAEPVEAASAAKASGTAATQLAEPVEAASAAKASGTAASQPAEPVEAASASKAPGTANNQPAEPVEAASAAPKPIEAKASAKAASAAPAAKAPAAPSKPDGAAFAKAIEARAAARSAGSDRPRRDDRGTGRRDGQGAQRRDGNGSRGLSQGGSGAPRRDGQGSGAPRRDGSFSRDGARPGAGRGIGTGAAGAGRPGQGKPAGGRGFAQGGNASSGVSKNEARGGKGTLNKKERENRGKEKQSVEKTGRFAENTKNINKGGKQAGRGKAPVAAAPVKEVVDDGIKTIILPEKLTITELAEKMKMAPAALVKALFMKGTMLTINAEIPFEQAEEIALEFNYICEKEVKVDVIEELLKEEDDPEETKETRPPVVCVMGHVDHGKTSLLDAIRSTNVIAKEAGGITQHIGAYTVKCNGKDITFLDTPGHEAFTAMRMRGAQATDIAVLVVAADDGVMPQTVEAINHAKAAGVDIIVAVNKIDKPGANVEKVKQELMEYELVSEEWGGSTIFVPVSAKTHENIDMLLEMILLDAEVKDLKANPNRAARGLVIEAQLDKGRGPVATMLVQKGTLHVGDNVAVGSCFGKVRAMIDDKGRRVKEAKPSMPVEILGLNDVPGAGDVFVCTETEKEARNFAETFISENREKLLDETKTRLTLDSLNSQIQEGKLKELNLIVKADVQGSVEAVKTSLLKLSNDEIVVKVIHSAVGAINESDVSLASASNAIIIGFNTRPDPMAKSVADQEKVEIRLYRVIYQAIEDIEAAMKGMLDPIYEEKVIGHAVVRQTFKASGVGTIAGSYVTDGIFQRSCKIRIRRGGEQIYEGALASLKRFKDDVKEVREGYECGLVFEKFNDLQIDDEIEAYIMQEVPR